MVHGKLQTGLGKGPVCKEAQDGPRHPVNIPLVAPCRMALAYLQLLVSR